MITGSIVLFVIAALLGVYLVWHILRDKPTPKGIAFTHGPVAALGLLLLIVYAIRQGGVIWLPVALFALAAVGGLWLIATDLRGSGPSKVLALMHGGLAVAALLVLLYVLSQ